MLTITITNLSSTAAIGSGSTTPLPAPFSWLAIAASGSASVACRVSDIEAAAGRLSGFSVADVLQGMVQNGLITVSFANKVVAHDDDVLGTAIANET